MVFTNEEYEEMAIQSIRTYLNKNLSDEYIKQKYRLAVKRMIVKAKNIENSKPVGVKSITESEVSMSFENTVDLMVVDNEIKALLPAPYIKMY